MNPVNPKLISAADQLAAALRTLEVLDPPLEDGRTKSLSDLSALAFHLNYSGIPPLLVILGGTGTGKSTLLNRLLGAAISATSYRRTFTAGPIAVAADASMVPVNWLGVDHLSATDLPARGESSSLLVVTSPQIQSMPPVVLVDTPDLDGDQPAHHQAADRAFRWASGIVFVVTPEKYQMTELLAYYRLALRYGLSAWFVMNKAEGGEVVADYVQQLAGHGWPGARVFVVPRDDSAVVPPSEQSLESLRSSLVDSQTQHSTESISAALEARKMDLVNRVMDQLVAPLKQQRSEVERTLKALGAMNEPTAEIDVQPLAEQLRIRLRQKSIVYLMGPGRMLERLRQTPGLVGRWGRNLLKPSRGQTTVPPDSPAPALDADHALDFAAILREQFVILQSRIDDILRDSPTVARRLNDPTAAVIKIDPAQAGAIVEDELQTLRKWLEQRWNQNPRDTLLVMKLLRFLPGGQRITKAVEAAPYLLLIFFVLNPGHMMHEAIFGAGYAAVMAIISKLSDEVAAHIRATNRRIARRFTELGQRQIAATQAWIRQQVPPARQLETLEQAVNYLADTAA